MTEENLIEKAQKGDDSALSELISMYQPDIKKFARQICKTPEDIEDATQQTLFIVYSKISSFRSLSKFTTWLFEIVKNECLRLGRKFGIHFKDEERDLEELASENNPEEQVTVEKIKASILKLEFIYREVFILREIQGLSTAETAKYLKISTTAVKSRLHRARDLIRNELRVLK